MGVHHAADGTTFFVAEESPDGDPTEWESDDETAQYPISGHPDDDDGEVFAHDFLETDQNPLDNRNLEQGVVLHAPAVIAKDFLVGKRVVGTSSLQASGAVGNYPGLLVPKQHGRKVLHIWSDAAGLRIARNEGDLAQCLPLAKIGTDGGADVYIYNYDGPIWCDAPTVATVNVGWASEIEVMNNDR